MTRLRPAAALAALALVPAGAAAQAPPAWHPAVPILAGEVADSPAAATAANGESLAVVARKVGSRYVVQTLSRHAPRGAFGAPQTVSTAATRPFGQLAAAVLPNGNAVAAWITPAGGVQLARRTGRTGTWRRAGLSTRGAAGVRVALAATGRTAVLWTTRAEPIWALVSANAPSIAASFVPGANLGADAVAPPAIALDATGAAAAAWLSATDARVRAARLRPGLAWDPAADLSAPGAADVDVAVDATGGAAAVWTRAAPSTGLIPATVEGALRNEPDAAWTPVAISPAGNFPRVARGTLGQITIAWAEFVGTDGLAVKAAVVAPGTAVIGPVATVDDDFEYPSAILRLQEARLVPAGADGAALTWADPEGPGSESLNGATLRAGVWSPVQPLVQYERTRPPGVATAPNGNALVVAGRTGEFPEVRAAFFDAQPLVRLTATVRGPATVRRGGRITWIFRVTNPGRVPARDVVVRHFLPTGMAFVRSTPAATRLGTGERRWRLGTIPARGTRTVALVTTTAARLGPRLSSILVTALEVVPFTASGQTVVKR